jgi:DNA polymerase-3 subunit delta
MPSPITYSAAVKLIEKAATPLCLLLYGPEDYLKEDLTRRAEAALLAPGMKSFNYSAFDLAENSLAEVLAAAEAFPALGGARLVVVRNAGKLSRSKKDRELLQARLSSPPESLAIIFVAGDLDRKSTLVGALQGTLSPVLLKTLSERDLDRWMVSKASSMDLCLSGGARRLLLDLTDRSMWRISNELEKLRVNAGDEGDVTEKDVLLIVPGSGLIHPFALANAIRSGDRAGAARVAAELLERGEEPVGLTALVGFQFFRSWASCAEALQPGSRRAAEFRRKAMLLCETDSALKRSKVEKSLAAQLMVDALTRPPK